WAGPPCPRAKTLDCFRPARSGAELVHLRFDLRTVPLLAHARSSGRSEPRSDEASVTGVSSRNSNAVRPGSNPAFRRLASHHREPAERSGTKMAGHQAMRGARGRGEQSLDHRFDRARAEPRSMPAASSPISTLVAGPWIDPLLGNGPGVHPAIPSQMGLS